MKGMSAELLEAFQFRYRNWDALTSDHPPFLTEPLVLSRHDHETIVSITERVHSLLMRARHKVTLNPDLCRFLGLDDWTTGLLRMEEALTKNLEIARYDLFRTRTGGWQISEVNSDVPSGFNESSFMNETLCRDSGVEIPLSVTERFADELASLGAGKIAMVYGTAYAEDLQLCLFLRDRLAERGRAALLASPAHLKMRKGQPCFWDDVVQAVYRVYPVEWFSALSHRDAWKELIQAGVVLVNPFRTIITQSKNFFALLHRDSETFFSKDDWTWLKGYLPYTKPFALRDTGTLLKEKERWVLKPVFGRMGYDVSIGPDCSVENWQKALDDAGRKPESFCLQEFFDVEPHDLGHERVYLCIGVFVVNGKFAGYFTRASLGRLTTYEAMDVATVIELS